MVRNLTKNFFAILRYNPLLAAIALLVMLIINIGPFAGICLAHGWAIAGYVLALLSIFAIYVGMSWKSDIPPRYVFLHPIGALLFGFAVVRSTVLTMARGGVVWRGTWYSLKELKEFSRESPHWSWI